jgi:hypothetical protein
MADDGDRTAELEREVQRLEDEVERYRTATEDTLQQLDWCIGYFTGCNKQTIAKSLGANRAYIRRHLLDRPEQGLPSANAES